jgi:hypothetical protein
MHRTCGISPSLLVITFFRRLFWSLPVDITLLPLPLLLLSNTALHLLLWSFINSAYFHDLLFRRASVRLPPADICVVSDYLFAPAPRADRFSHFYSFFFCARFILLPPSAFCLCAPLLLFISPLCYFSPLLSSVASLICFHQRLVFSYPPRAPSSQTHLTPHFH